MTDANNGDERKGDANDAAAWVVRMHSDQVTGADEAAFAAWLAADPAHRLAYDNLAATWQGAGQAMRDDADLRDRLNALRAEQAPAPSRPARRAFVAAAVAALAVAAGVGTWGTLQLAFGPQVYETAFGEQRRIVLDDGSVVVLNTQSRLKADFAQTERRLWLDKGQAHFTVAKDARRPFRVFAGDEEVRALGTQFEVRRDGPRVRVTLEEGVVALYRNSAAASLAAATKPEAVLKPGEQALAAPETKLTVIPVDAARTVAWRFGRMILDAQPLGEAIAEINRYNTRRIVLVDRRLAALPISGVFQTGRPEAFVEALTKAFPVKVVRETSRTIELTAAEGR